MVTEGARARTIEALSSALGPVIRVLLRTGVTWRDFSELGKALFVKIATEEFGIRGRPTNSARTAILTGLDRREVSKLRRMSGRTTSPSIGFVSKPTLVLGAWHNDPAFRDANGKPRELETDGGAGSFAELVRRVAPGIPVVAMIKELRGAGAIEELPDGRLRVLKRTYIPADFSENQIRLWASDLESLGTTIEHNLWRRGRSAPRFQRRAINANVDARKLAEFREFLQSEGQAFLERVDDWLAAHESVDGDGVRLGVGVFHIEDPTEIAKTRRLS